MTDTVPFSFLFFFGGIELIILVNEITCEIRVRMLLLVAQTGLTWLGADWGCEVWWHITSVPDCPVALLC